MRRIRNFFWCVASVICCASLYGNLASADANAFPLRQSFDRGLQTKLDTALRQMGLGDAIKKKSISVALVNLSDPWQTQVAAINGDTMMYAASLPKIAILLGAFERIYAGDMLLDEATYKKLEKMIRFSSNSAATEMLLQVGERYLADVLRSPRYRLYDTRVNGGLWVGKAYGQRAAWKRDPLHNLSHGATALQTAKFYYLLETGQLVSPRFSQVMKKLLGNPGISHKFVKGIKAVAPNAEIYRKSGTWRTWHADSAIIEHDGLRYIAVALMDSPQGGHWLTQIIGEMDQIIREQSAHNLLSANRLPRNPSDMPTHSRIIQ